MKIFLTDMFNNYYLLCYLSLIDVTLEIFLIDVFNNYLLNIMLKRFWGQYYY